VSFAGPERRRSGPLDQSDVDLLVAALGLDGTDVVSHQWCDNGPPWQALLLDSTERVLAVRPDAAALAGRYVAVAARLPVGAPIDLEVRAFFPGGPGLVEDPVTGSLNAALGQWLIGAGLLPTSYVAAQGSCLERAGRVYVESVEGQIWVGGSCRTVVEGVLRL
jgi:predicted PhzF superfamily epimerase YddE/YHI9